MLKSVIVTTALLGTTAAYCQTPTHAPTHIAPATRAAAPSTAGSSYCQTASAGFLQSDSAGFAAMSGCSRGDTIIIPGGSTSVVARVCDYSKAIVAAGGVITCSVVSPLRNRK
jgi:hypothetical protein